MRVTFNSTQTQQGCAFSQCILAYLLLRLKKSCQPSWGSSSWRRACPAGWARCSEAAVHPAGSHPPPPFPSPEPHGSCRQAEPRPSCRDCSTLAFVLILDAKCPRAADPGAPRRLQVKTGTPHGQGCLAAFSHPEESVRTSVSTIRYKKWTVGLNEHSIKEALGWTQQGLLGPISHLALMLSPVLLQQFFLVLFFFLS